MCSSIEVSKADRVARERQKAKDREIAIGTQREREREESRTTAAYNCNYKIFQLRLTRWTHQRVAPASVPPSLAASFASLDAIVINFAAVFACDWPRRSISLERLFIKKINGIKQ